MILPGRSAEKEHQRKDQERFSEKKKYDPDHVHIDAGGGRGKAMISVFLMYEAFYLI